MIAVEITRYLAFFGQFLLQVLHQHFPVNKSQMRKVGEHQLGEGLALSEMSETSGRDVAAVGQLDRAQGWTTILHEYVNGLVLEILAARKLDVMQFAHSLQELGYKLAEMVESAGRYACVIRVNVRQEHFACIFSLRLLRRLLHQLVVLGELGLGVVESYGSATLYNPLCTRAIRSNLANTLHISTKSPCTLKPVQPGCLRLK
ncbi:hypothetical protein PENTCL1PPCAC_16396 [Pristionchus entomophagus]|uniref:Uncharacterized protein n=1 Tax=Pristionchus entomophagus TaxID=358040 RepID=A0AAV5TIW0_9BILA|nr:hypothetical protein PENTCL1PPCAC_16396 [Pristionchus entomophagus]